jgi:demethylmenaquinone methyltransferase/2-methoxy-6-polyprenyl-1,4-benzoquinol methylase
LSQLGKRLARRLPERPAGEVSAPLSEPDLLHEQLEYYRARAGEYDRWFRREGRHDRGEQANAAWVAEADQVRRALGRLALQGAEVLELAAGTGIWTLELVRLGARVTAVDGAPEMIAENRRRLGTVSGHVEHVRANLFEWRPDRRFDAVVFCFWISHVPDARLAAFLDRVHAALRDGGEVFFLDGLPEPTSTAADHVLPTGSDETMIRRLDDGREYRIVKRFRSSRELESACREAGLEVTVHETASYFQYGIGRRACAPADPPGCMPRA